MLTTDLSLLGALIKLQSGYKLGWVLTDPRGRLHLLRSRENGGKKWKDHPWSKNPGVILILCQWVPLLSLECGWQF